MKKTIIVVLFVLVLAGIAYWYSQKDGAKVEGEKGKEPLKDVEKPVTSSPLSANDGAGGAAVKNRIAEIMRSSKASEIRRNNGIGGDMFKDVDNEKVKALIRANALGTLTDEYELQLIPVSINTAFLGKVDELVKLTDGATEKKIFEYGANKYSDRLMQLTNFQDVSNFKLINKMGDIIDGGKGYGSCKGSGSREDECKIKNWRKLSNSLNLVGKRMQKETEAFENAVKLYAINEMKANGWNFVGY